MFTNRGDNRYISLTVLESRPRNEKSGTAGQQATPQRPPLKESNEEQLEGNRRHVKGVEEGVGRLVVGGCVAVSAAVVDGIRQFVEVCYESQCI